MSKKVILKGAIVWGGVFAFPFLLIILVSPALGLFVAFSFYSALVYLAKKKYDECPE